jgi:hypothetical protein
VLSTAGASLTIRDWGSHGAEDVDVGLLGSNAVSALKMETVCYYETSESAYKSTWRYNPDDQHRQVPLLQLPSSRPSTGVTLPFSEGWRFLRFWFIPRDDNCVSNLKLITAVSFLTLPDSLFMLSIFPHLTLYSLPTTNTSLSLSIARHTAVHAAGSSGRTPLHTSWHGKLIQ